MHRAVDFFRSFKICTYEISGTVLRNNGKENIGRSKIKIISNFQVTTTPGGGGGVVVSYEMGRDARRKIQVIPLRDVGVAQAETDP